jgi:Frataxin-like domain
MLYSAPTTETSEATLTEHQFHPLADSTLESLQDQLDTLIEEKLDDGDVTLKVWSPPCNSVRNALTSHWDRVERRRVFW